MSAPVLASIRTAPPELEPDRAAMAAAEPARPSLPLSKGQCWDRFVDAHPQATFFHHYAWRGVIEQTFGHRTHYLTVGDGEAIEAVLPLVEIKSRLFGHMLISNGFCIGGGPLAHSDAARDAIIAKAERLGRELRVDYIELRDTPTAAPDWTAKDDLYAGFERSIAADEEENLRQIPKRQRAVVRKALQQDLRVEVETTADAFFRVYSRTMRDHGTPALPRKFFDVLLETFAGRCDVLTVYRGDKPLSSVVSYYFRDRVMPYFTGSDLAARQCGANDLLYWALMRSAAARGCTVFDFGRSKVGTGPFAFKRNWGFEPRPITHQYRLIGAQTLPNLNPTNPRYGLMIQAWRRLPLPLATAISPLLSRSLG